MKKKRQTRNRELAKTGMAVSLGTLVVTGFFRFRFARLIHPWAGAALLGFTLWHHWLNTQRSKSSLPAHQESH